MTTAPDGLRLFVEPKKLQAQPSSWPPVGMQATACETITFADVVMPCDAAVTVACGAGPLAHDRAYGSGSPT